MDAQKMAKLPLKKSRKKKREKKKKKKWEKKKVREKKKKIKKLKRVKMLKNQEMKPRQQLKNPKKNQRNQQKSLKAVSIFLKKIEYRTKADIGWRKRFATEKTLPS